MPVAGNEKTLHRDTVKFTRCHENTSYKLKIKIKSNACSLQKNNNENQYKDLSVKETIQTVCKKNTLLLWWNSYPFFSLYFNRIMLCRQSVHDLI